MLPSPAEGGPDRRGGAGHSTAEHGFMAAPVAEASVSIGHPWQRPA